MSEQRFFIKNISPSAKKMIFPADISHQMKHVLRYQPGEKVVVLDGEGKAYQVEIETVDQDLVTAIVCNVGEETAQVSINVALYFPLSRREKVEWILQKGTEVGVSEFHPFTSERSLVQKKPLDQKKTQRWESIIREAAEQSGRAILPELFPPVKLNGIMEKEFTQHDYDLALVASVSEKQKRLANMLDSFSVEKRPSIALFVGAEGGFSDNELRLFDQTGVQSVSLGMHILRMETAAIVFPALVIHHLTAAIS